MTGVWRTSSLSSALLLCIFYCFCIGKEASELSTVGYWPGIAIDGNYNNLQHTMDGIFDPWYQLDMEKVHLVNGIKIWNRPVTGDSTFWSK